ncbi:MAG: orotidine-5'-phosphate decarboxylase [Gammaproteobacteria bacterium]
MENRIIIPLDLDYSQAISIAKTLDPNICRLKVGSQLFTSSGPKVIKELHSLGFDIFLDLKFHDIPNTVHESVKSAADLGVWMVNVHASGGSKMLEASNKALVGYENPPLLIGVTVLTSLSEEEIKEIGLKGIKGQVLQLAGLVKDNGLDGVVCAASDTTAIKSKFGEEFLTVSPGIRPANSNTNDQSRVATPSEAIKNGSDYLVIGRPVTGSKNPKDALEKIYKEIS